MELAGSVARVAQPLLIVNADDFGLTAGVCRGVLAAHERGVVTSTSALVVAPAFDAHAAALRDSGLAVGAHLAAVGEDPPLLGPREVPSLWAGPAGFPTTWRGFVARAAAGRVDPGDLRAEFGAQLDKLTSTGVCVTHLDTHMNLHLWPALAAVLLDLAAERRIAAVRVPRAAGHGPVSTVVRVLSRRLARRSVAGGLRFPEASSGFDERVPLGPERIGAWLASVSGAGVTTAELVAHLGRGPDAELARYRTRFRWSDEFDAVCDRRTAAVVEASGFRLGSFADLTPAPAIHLPAAGAPARGPLSWDLPDGRNDGRDEVRGTRAAPTG